MRVDGKVRQSIVQHVGVADSLEQELQLRELAEVTIAKLEADASPNLSLLTPEQVAGSGKRKPARPRCPAPEPEAVKLADVEEEARVVEGIGDVFGALYRQLGFDRILEGPAGSVLEATVLARAAQPESKHRTQKTLAIDFDVHIPLDRIYRMMDGLYRARERVQDRVFEATVTSLPEQRLDLCFFDVTTLYFESVEEDDLRAFGYSKDQKFHQVQVVLALATTSHGLPVGYKLFRGSTADVSTLMQCVEAWRERIPIDRVVFVGDRAMMSEANLSALEAVSAQYILGASLKKLAKPLQGQVLEQAGYRLADLEGDVVWTREFELGPSRRLIASYSSRRAKKDASDRNRILEKLRTKIGKTQKGALKRLVSNRGYLKYVEAEGSATASIDEAKVARDAVWDGMFGVVTNCKDWDAHAVLARYRKLWTVEEAFRISKHDLRMRPIFHYLPRRIEAHIAICFLSYALLRHAQHRLRLAGHTISTEALRDELARVQASLLRHKRSGALYRVPSRMSELARAVYDAFGIERPSSPSLVA